MWARGLTPGDSHCHTERAWPGRETCMPPGCASRAFGPSKGCASKRMGTRHVQCGDYGSTIPLWVWRRDMAQVSLRRDVSTNEYMMLGAW